MEEPPQNEKLFTKNFILTSLSTVAIFLSFYFLLVTLPKYIVDELRGSESQIGLIIGVFTITAVFLRPFIGIGVDVVGRKRILVAGLLMFLIAMLLYDYTTSVTSLLLLRVFHGIGWGAATTAATTLIADIAPPRRRGEAMGFFGMSANIAMAIGPALSIMLLDVAGYTVLFMTGAAIALVSLLLALPITETAVVHPKASLFSREALFPSSIMFAVSLTYGSIVSFLPLFATKQGIANPGVFFTVFAITILLIRALAGKLSDIRGRRFVIVPGMILTALGLWVLSAANSLPVFLASALLYGMGFGLVHPTMMALLVDMVSERGRGAAMGTFTASFDLGIGAGSILMGVVLELADKSSLLREQFGQFAGFTAIYLLGGLVVIAAMIVFVFTYEKNTGKI